MSDLTSKKCRPCEGDVEPLGVDAAKKLLKDIHPDWKLCDAAKRIERVFEFKGYARTIAFANVVAWVATVEGHHPEMSVHYGKVVLSYNTHSIGGLSENDFICAAKIDQFAGQQ